MGCRIPIDMIVVHELEPVLADQIGSRPHQESKLVTEGIIDTVFKHSSGGVIIFHRRETIGSGGRESRRPSVARRQLVRGNEVITGPSIGAQAVLKVRLGLVGSRTSELQA